MVKETDHEALNSSSLQTMFSTCRAKSYCFESFHFTCQKLTIEEAGMQAFLGKTIHTHKDVH